jgi:hypothetical protein
VLIFPCRQALQGWIKAETGEKLAVHPIGGRGCDGNRWTGRLW